jgi:hypothetical protein
MIEIEKGFFIKKSKMKNKKYDIYVKVDNIYKKLLSFGQLPYEHFKDSTPLKLYTHLNHNDENRRRLYYLRHPRTTDKTSARYWSNRYLWG